MAKHGYVSGVPRDENEFAYQLPTFDQVMQHDPKKWRERERMRRRYSRRGTPATKRITDRIVGECK